VQLVNPRPFNTLDSAEYQSTLEAIREVRLASEIAGRIVAMPVYEGQPVRPGQLLFALDQIQQKATVNADAAEARAFLTMLSGRRHRVHTGVALAVPGQKLRTRLVTSVVAFQRLTTAQIEAYLEGAEWQGKAGGYAIQGSAEAWVRFMSGSWSNIVGLPLFETAQLLRGVGWLRP
jgi:septum formation protein